MARRALQFSLCCYPLDLVLNGQMALIALYFVLGNMGSMHQLRIVDLLQSLRFEVARTAIFDRYESVTDHRIAVTLRALHTVAQHIGVVETEVGAFFRRDSGPVVASLATGELFRKCDVYVAFLLHVTQETRRFSDEQVFALDYL